MQGDTGMTTNAGRVRVLIADARADVREALAALLEATDDFEVIGEAASPEEAAARAPALRPDVILVDPCGEYHGALPQLARDTKTLVILTLRVGTTCRAQARDLGALVIDKGTGPEDLLAILRRACCPPQDTRGAVPSPPAEP
jgi:DNA-binding NarL/FixJ family response regulator